MCPRGQSQKRAERDSSADDATNCQGVSVIIPAYNEAKAIEDELRSIVDAAAGLDSPLEILVVDDGSNDRTGEIAEGVAAVTVLRHRENRGYGAALKTGLRHARFELVCIIDADGTYPHHRIPQLIGDLRDGRHDMVVGARTADRVKIPLARRPAKWAIRKLAEYITGESIPDVNSGLRVFRKEVALRFVSMLPDGFSFTTTITLAMLTNGYLIKYFPINYSHRIGNSKIRPIRDTLNFVELVFRMALYFAPLKIFFPLSGVLLLVAVVWGLTSMFWLGQLADVSTLVIAMTAIQVAVIGMLAEAINRRLPNYYREQ